MGESIIRQRRTSALSLGHNITPGSTLHIRVSVRAVRLLPAPTAPGVEHSSVRVDGAGLIRVSVRAVRTDDLLM